MVSLCADACMRLNRAVVALADKDRSQGDGGPVRRDRPPRIQGRQAAPEGCAQDLRDRGDDDAVWQAIKMQEIYKLLETVIDSCKRAGKTIEEILIENA